jgi:hypothetical protein
MAKHRCWAERPDTTGKKLLKLRSLSSSHHFEHAAGSGHRAATVLEASTCVSNAFPETTSISSRKAAYFISAMKSALDGWDDEETEGGHHPTRRTYSYILSDTATHVSRSWSNTVVSLK